MTLASSIDPAFLPPRMLLLRIFSLAWAIAVCPISALLLLTGATGRGMMFAIGALLLGAAWLRPGRQGLRRATAGVVAFALWLLITLGLILASPNGAPRKSARVQNRYSSGGWHYPRFALGSLLPEIDQLLLGFKPMRAPTTFWYSAIANAS